MAWWSRTQGLTAEQAEPKKSVPKGIWTKCERCGVTAYEGDLDGNLWRFDLALDAHGAPAVSSAVRVASLGADQPIVGTLGAADRHEDATGRTARRVRLVAPFLPPG